MSASSDVLSRLAERRRVKDCKVCETSAQDQIDVGYVHAWPDCSTLAELVRKYEGGMAIRAIVAAQHAEVRRFIGTDALAEDFWTYSWVRTRLVWAGVKLRRRGRLRSLIIDRTSRVS